MCLYFHDSKQEYQQSICIVYGKSARHHRQLHSCSVFTEDFVAEFIPARSLKYIENRNGPPLLKLNAKEKWAQQIQPLFILRREK